MAIPYIILYNVTNNKNKMAQRFFYRTDTFYDADEYITELKYRASQAQMSMEKRALNEILRQLIDENNDYTV
jgi:predicted ATPase